METLYDKIGGAESIEKMITSFYQRVLADTMLAPFFEKTEIAKLHKMQTAFFSIALGGGEPEKMPNLAAVHRDRGIESKHLTRFMEILVETLAEVGIPESDMKRIYERIAAYSGDILGESSVDG